MAEELPESFVRTVCATWFAQLAWLGGESMRPLRLRLSYHMSPEAGELPYPPTSADDLVEGARTLRALRLAFADMTRRAPASAPATVAFERVADAFAAGAELLEREAASHGHPS